MPGFGIRPSIRTAVTALALLLAPTTGADEVRAQERVPVIFIPGITGSLLASWPDPDPRLHVVLWPPLYPAGPGDRAAAAAERGAGIGGGVGTVLGLPRVGAAIGAAVGGAQERSSATDDLVKVNDAFIRLSLNPSGQPPLRPPFSETIVATDAIRSYAGENYYGPILEYLVRTGGYFEYDVAGNPARRTLAGCDAASQPRLPPNTNPTLAEVLRTANKPSLFVFAYDWRLAIEDNVTLLADYVRCVGTVYPGQKVNLVTHSMGGLIARRYILDNPNRVNKLITVAAPFLGSAKPLYQIMYGLLDTELSMRGTLKEYLYGSAVMNMLKYYPGLHELMLSRQYYELGGPRYIVEARGQKTPLAYDDFVGLLDRLLPAKSYNGKTAAQSGRDFHDYRANGNGQDDWSNDTTGVRYFHLFGIRHVEDTPQSVRQQQGEVLDVDDRPAPGYHLEPWGPGDGTVPQLSAERIRSGRSVNAPNAQLFVFNTSADPLLEHSGIMTNPAVMAKVLELLGGDEDITGQPVHKVRTFLNRPTP